MGLRRNCPSFRVFSAQSECKGKDQALQADSKKARPGKDPPIPEHDSHNRKSGSENDSAPTEQKEEPLKVTIARRAIGKVDGVHGDHRCSGIADLGVDEQEGISQAKRISDQQGLRYLCGPIRTSRYPKNIIDKQQKKYRKDIAVQGDGSISCINVATAVGR